MLIYSWFQLVLAQWDLTPSANGFISSRVSVNLQEPVWHLQVSSLREIQTTIDVNVGPGNVAGLIGGEVNDQVGHF